DSKINEEKEWIELIDPKNENNSILSKYVSESISKSPQPYDIRQDNIQLFQNILSSPLRPRDMKTIENKIVQCEIGSNADENESKIELKTFYNNNIYLSKLIYLASLINNKVMKEIEKIFDP